MTMTVIPSPLHISSRLMAAMPVGDGTVHVHAADRDHVTGRVRYRYVIDGPGGVELHTGDDLESGVGADVDYVEAIGSLLSFLSAAADSRDFRERTGTPGENEDLFPAAVVDWAVANSDEITLAALELDELRCAA